MSDLHINSQVCVDYHGKIRAGTVVGFIDGQDSDPLVIFHESDDTVRAGARYHIPRFFIVELEVPLIVNPLPFDEVSE